MRVKNKKNNNNNRNDDDDDANIVASVTLMSVNVLQWKREESHRNRN